jgi:hypothetical protein
MIKFLRRKRRPVDDEEWLRFQASLDERLANAPDDRRQAYPFYEERMRTWRSEGLSPEEWAARNAQNLLCFSGGQYCYSDPSLDAWVRRLDTILFTHGAVDACRRHFLTDDEMRAVLAREAEPF